MSWGPDSSARCLNGSKGVEAPEIRDGVREDAEETTVSPVSMPESRITCQSRLFSCIAFAISSIRASHLF